MKNPNEDIYEMLDTLSLPVAAQRFMELSKSPELCNYTAMQFIREVLEPQYTETLNNRFETNLRLSSLINKGLRSRTSRPGTDESIMMLRYNRSCNSTSLRIDKMSESMA